MYTVIQKAELQLQQRVINKGRCFLLLLVLLFKTELNISKFKILM